MGQKQGKFAHLKDMRTQWHSNCVVIDGLIYTSPYYDDGQIVGLVICDPKKNNEYKEIKVKEYPNGVKPDFHALAADTKRKRLLFVGGNNECFLCFYIEKEEFVNFIKNGTIVKGIKTGLSPTALVVDDVLHCVGGETNTHAFTLPLFDGELLLSGYLRVEVKADIPFVVCRVIDSYFGLNAPIPISFEKSKETIPFTEKTTGITGPSLVFVPNKREMWAMGGRCFGHFIYSDSIFISSLSSPDTDKWCLSSDIKLPMKMSEFGALIVRSFFLVIFGGMLATDSYSSSIYCLALNRKHCYSKHRNWIWKKSTIEIPKKGCYSAVEVDSVVHLFEYFSGASHFSIATDVLLRSVGVAPAVVPKEKQ